MGFVDRFASSVRQKRALLRERGFASVHLAAKRGVDRRGTHERCGPGGWPGPHLFWQVAASPRRQPAERRRFSGGRRRYFAAM